MSNTRCPSFNWLLIPLCAIVVGVLTMRLGVIEVYLLFAYTIFVVAAHVHYGIRVVCTASSALLRRSGIGRFQLHVQLFGTPYRLTFRTLQTLLFLNIILRHIFKRVF